MTLIAGLIAEQVTGASPTDNIIQPVMPPAPEPPHAEKTNAAAATKTGMPCRLSLHDLSLYQGAAIRNPRLLWGARLDRATVGSQARRYNG